MITAIDTNILIDVFGADPTYGQPSAQALRQCLKEGSLHACDIVWAETATVFATTQAFKDAMHVLQIEFSSLQLDSSLYASQAWKEYRKAGGKRQRIMADFLIGAHAAKQCNRFLTRDRGFYRSYFKNLQIIDPSN